MRQLTLFPGFEITIEGTTVGSADVVTVKDLAPHCGDQLGTADALYRIHLEDPMIVYADTFGNAAKKADESTFFDSIIFMFKVNNPMDPPSQWQFVGCQDDGGCGTDTTADLFKQPQFVARVEPGDYVLGVTGFAGASGRFHLHVQSAFASRRGQIIKVTSGPDPVVQSLVGSTNGPNEFNGVDAPRCQFFDTVEQGPSIAPDFQYLMLSCPDFPGGDFYVDSLSGQTDFDTVLTLGQGNQAQGDGYLCNDDHDDKFLNSIVPFFQRQSILGRRQLGATTLFIGREPIRFASGAGLRTFYVDGFFDQSKGNFMLFTQFPRGAAVDSGAFENSGPLFLP
jgi:hypothetical protein